MSKLRYLVYIAIGALFGVADYHFQEIMPDHYALANWGIWLILLVPIAIYEMRASGFAWRAIVASALVWETAIVSYYFYYANLLRFDGAVDVWGDMWGQISTWSAVALGGGAIIGLIFALICRRFLAKKVA